MDPFTIVGYITGVVGFVTTMYYIHKYQQVKALNNTIETLNKENESLRNLLDAKEKTIDQFNKDLTSLKNQMTISQKVMEAKIEDIRKELEMIKQKSAMQENEIMHKDAQIRDYRETLIHLSDACDHIGDVCNVCDPISRVLNKY